MVTILAYCSDCLSPSTLLILGSQLAAFIIYSARQSGHLACSIKGYEAGEYTYQMLYCRGVLAWSTMGFPFAPYRTPLLARMPATAPGDALGSTA